MEKTGCKIICGAPTTLAVEGFMMMIMMMPQTPLDSDDVRPVPQTLFDRNEKPRTEVVGNNGPGIVPVRVENVWGPTAKWAGSEDGLTFSRNRAGPSISICWFMGMYRLFGRG